MAEELSPDPRTREVFLLQYKAKIADVVGNAHKYHKAYYLAETFRGPSLYFHQRSLATRQSLDFRLHAEYIYATLASWGMHRMGRRGSKMRSFDEFWGSLAPMKKLILEAKRIDYRRIRASEWGLLERIFRGIRVMASGTTLVGNSKVMAHMLPDMVPPIDREYTLRYLRGSTSIRNDIDGEWQLMREIIEAFFIPIAQNDNFRRQANRWMSHQAEYPWDTSVFKVIDNMVIGAGKRRS